MIHSQIPGNSQPYRTGTNDDYVVRHTKSYSIRILVAVAGGEHIDSQHPQVRQMNRKMVPSVESLFVTSQGQTNAGTL